MSETKDGVSLAEARLMKIRQAEFLNAIADERARQDAKWGQNFVPLDRMVTILGEEFGEACRALLEQDWVNLDEELVQVAAVCSKFFELATVSERRRK